MASTIFTDLGSAAWTNGEEYGGEEGDRIEQFRKTVNFQALQTYASGLRNGRPCSISSKFSVGNFNVVHKIEFDDGVEWIARLRMDTVTDRVLMDMESELATMEFVRQNTSIPVPQVYGCDLSSQNSVGCAFLLLEYIRGNTAEEVAKSYPGDRDGIPAQVQDHFWRQLAKIMVELASVRLPKIGSIFRDENDPSVFKIGPIVETDSGPYSTAAEFYADYPMALGRQLGDGADGQQELLDAFRSIMSTPLSATKDTGLPGFGLVNSDLNPNNIIVDREFNVLAVIDWDSVIAAPDPFMYRLPFLMGISSAVPGEVSTHLAVLERERLGRKFVETVETVSREEASNDDHNDNKSFLFTTSEFFSKEAVTVRSLTFVEMRQDWVNREWLQGLEWLSKQDEEDAVRFYLETS